MLTALFNLIAVLVQTIVCTDIYVVILKCSSCGVIGWEAFSSGFEQLGQWLGNSQNDLQTDESFSSYTWVNKRLWLIIINCFFKLVLLVESFVTLYTPHTPTFIFTFSIWFKSDTVGTNLRPVYLRFFQILFNLLHLNISISIPYTLLYTFP